MAPFVRYERTPMQPSTNPDIPFVASILHPSDFSEGSELAFEHALAIALLRKTEFTMLHVSRAEPTDDDWTQFPAVRGTLERWGVLERGKPRSAVFDELQIQVKKVNVRHHNPLAAILDYLDINPMELIVLATEGRAGLPRWIRPSVAEQLARRSRTLTLFVPKGARGFVSTDTGKPTLRRILIPVDTTPAPRPALVYAERIANHLATARVEINLLHVSEPGERLEIELPDNPRCVWKTTQRRGDVVEEILAAAAADETELIAMTTEGHEGILDAFRGSITEQVLRRAPCPLLAVPAR
jgi:nucleotide-binding universal stress UspA family protein